MKIINFTELTLELAKAGCMVLDMPNDAYHAYAGISKSGLDVIARSPAHFKYRPKHEPSRAMVIGSATHAAVLEPTVFNKQYALLKEVTDRRSAEYKQAVKLHGADNVLICGEIEQIAGMQAALNKNKYAAELLVANGWCEIACFATDPETGVLVKCKFDKLLNNLQSVDLKTTLDVREFYKSVANYRYHVQEAFYSDVFEWATGEQINGFDFLAVEKEMPHASRIFRLDSNAVQYGRKLYREALNTYADCIQQNKWPMPPGDLEYIGLPNWASDPEQQEF